MEAAAREGALEPGLHVLLRAAFVAPDAENFAPDDDELVAEVEAAGRQWTLPSENCATCGDLVLRFTFGLRALPPQEGQLILVEEILEFADAERVSWAQSTLGVDMGIVRP